MPDKKKGLIQRPPDATNPYQGRGVKVIPWQEEDAATRFMGGLTGDDLPGGGVAGLIGAIVGMGNPVKGLTGAKAAANLAKSQTSTPIKSLPHWADAYQQSGKYTPEVSAEMGRLIGEMLPDKKYKAAWQEFHKMNPEATGHVREVTIGANTDSWNPIKRFKDWYSGDVGQHLPEAKAVHRWTELEAPGEREWAGVINLRPSSRSYLQGANSKEAVMGHELQHQAQQMIEGANQLRRNYWKLDKQYGYENNPYEIEANRVGGEIVQRLMGKK